MNIDAYNTIIDTIEPVLSAKGLKPVDGEDEAYFSNDTTAVKVTFDDTANVFLLSVSDATEGKPSGAWKQLSKWIFMPDYTVKDAKSIGNDFYDTLNEALGLKKTVTRTSDVVVSDDARSSMSLEGLLQRFLTIFPQYKEEYKEHVEKYGECLYVNFFEATAVPCLRSLLRENDKKRLKKYFELLNEIYTLGDRNAASVVSVVILGGALNNEDKLTEIALDYMKDYKYLTIALNQVKEEQKKHKNDKNA